MLIPHAVRLILGAALVFGLGLPSLWSLVAQAEDRPPLGLVEVTHPDTNPATPAKIELGKRLFFDKKLSRDGSLSCATCHQPEQAFAQRGVPISIGIDGKLGRRNAPSLFNVAFAQSLFFDGRSSTLEEQAWEPILADDEMGNESVEEVLERLASSDYAPQFKAVFGVERPDRESVAKALACFQRTLLSGNSAFDRWNWGNSDALSEKAHAGYRLFAGRAQCWQCHPLNSEAALLLTDHSFHNTGVSDLGKNGVNLTQSSSKRDLGRFEVTEESIDRFQFKTPSLRNVALTAPYMHDGSLATLNDVVEFYNRAEGGGGELLPLSLDESEVEALVAFLEALTGEDLKLPGKSDDRVRKTGGLPSNSDEENP